MRACACLMHRSLNTVRDILYISLSRSRASFFYTLSISGPYIHYVLVCNQHESKIKCIESSGSHPERCEQTGISSSSHFSITEWKMTWNVRSDIYRLALIIAASSWTSGDLTTSWIIRSVYYVHRRISCFFEIYSIFTIKNYFNRCIWVH